MSKAWCLEGGLIERRVHRHPDGHHVGLIVHHDPVHTPNNVCVHVPNPTNPIHDDNVQCLRVSDHDYELCLRLRALFVRVVHGPSVHVLNDHEWTVRDDAALHTDVVSVLLWTSLFVVVRASI